MWELSEKKYLVRLLLLSFSFHQAAPGTDEDLPAKLKDVSYRDASSPLGSQSTSVSPSAPPSSSYYPAPVSVDTPTDRLLELRLLHHYLKMASTSSATSLADAGDTAGQHTWSTWITDLAVNTPTLMVALLGFSAFHLRYLSPFDQTISEASHKYMLRAITSQAKQLREGVDENSCSRRVLLSLSMRVRTRHSYIVMRESAGCLYIGSVHISVPGQF
jgi:hypothetical protein